MIDGLEEIGLPPLAGPGHNRPPAYEPNEDALKVFAEAKTLIAHTGKWLKERPEITDAEMAGALQLTINQLRAVHDALDAQCKAARKPYDDPITVIMAQFSPVLVALKDCVAKLRPLATAWLQRQRDENQSKPQIKGDYSRKAMGLHSHWKARVVDKAKAMAYYADDADVLAAALAEITRKATRLAAAQKGKGPIPPGIAFYNEERAQ